MSLDTRSPASIWRRAGIAGAAAVVVNLLVLGVARLADVSFAIPAWDGEGTLTIGIGAVLLMTIVPFAIATALAAVVVPRSRRGTVILAVVAAVVAVGSFVPPLTLDAATATRSTLAAMHVPVVLAYLAVLLPALRRRPADASGVASDRDASADARLT